MDLGLGAVSLTFQVFSGCVKGTSISSQCAECSWGNLSMQGTSF